MLRDAFLLKVDGLKLLWIFLELLFFLLGSTLFFALCTPYIDADEAYCKADRRGGQHNDEGMVFFGACLLVCFESGFEAVLPDDQRAIINR